MYVYFQFIIFKNHKCQGICLKLVKQKQVYWLNQINATDRLF